MHSGLRRTKTVPNRILEIERRLDGKYERVPKTGADNIGVPNIMADAPSLPADRQSDVEHEVSAGLTVYPAPLVRAFAVDDGLPIHLQYEQDTFRELGHPVTSSGSGVLGEGELVPILESYGDDRTSPTSVEVSPTQVPVRAGGGGASAAHLGSTANEAADHDSGQLPSKLQSNLPAQGEMDWANLDETAKEQPRPSDGSFLANLKTLVAEAKHRSESGQETPSVSDGEIGNEPHPGTLSPERRDNATSGHSASAEDGLDVKRPRPGRPVPETEPNRHAVFDQLGQQMQRAARFDAGTVPVDKTFAAIEASLDAQAAHDAATHRLRTDRKPTAPPLSAIERVEDMALMGQPAVMASAPYAAARVEAHMLSTDIPLDPGIGGRSISVDALEAGDLLVSTTREVPSKLIRSGTGSPVSHAMLYIGDGSVIEAIGEGVTLRTLGKAVAESSLVVAFRHPELSSEQARRVRDYARMQIGKSFNWIGVVKQAGFKLDQKTYCSGKSGEDLDRCIGWAGKVNLGTATNDRFYCSELVLRAYQEAGLPLTTSPPNYSNPGDIPQLQQKGALAYVGHIKYEL